MMKNSLNHSVLERERDNISIIQMLIEIHRPKT